MQDEASRKPAPRRPKQKKEYKHPCPFCERMFTCNHNVNQHINEKHRVERDHKCPECGAAFARPWPRNRHLLSLHGIDVRPGRGKAGRKRKGKDEVELGGDGRGGIGMTKAIELDTRTSGGENSSGSSPAFDMVYPTRISGNGRSFLGLGDQSPFDLPIDNLNHPFPATVGTFSFPDNTDEFWGPIFDDTGHHGSFELFETNNDGLQAQPNEFQQFDTSMFNREDMVDFGGFSAETQGFDFT